MGTALQAIKAELSKLSGERDQLDKQISALEAARSALDTSPKAAPAKKAAAQKPSKKKTTRKRSARLDAKTKAAIQEAVLSAAPDKGKTGVAKSVLVKAGSGAAKSASAVQVGSIIDALRTSKKLKMKGSRSKAVYTK